MHDVVIRGGTIVDGTGADLSFVSAMSPSTMVTRSRQSVAPLAPARKEYDATGKLVTPGWVDVHTHYDGQATWDPMLAPSSWHGVTTVMFGNCGVGFAPCKPADRDALIDLMEGVEDIPGIVLERRPEVGLGELPGVPGCARGSANRAPSTWRPRCHTTRCASM